MNGKRSTEQKSFGDTTSVFLQNVAPLAKPTILVVMSDTAARERLMAVARSADFDVASAADGDEALGYLRREYCPIVITEWSLSNMDALQLCRAIRADSLPAYVYVLLLADQNAQPKIQSSLEGGIDDYLNLPAAPTELLARLRTARRIVELEQSLRSIVEEKRKLATTDSLTGINNWRYFYKHLDREIKRVQRYGGPMSLLAMNLDYLQSINDRFSVAVGDEILVEFARRITLGLPREIDWCARISDVEFAVVLPQTDLEGASAVAEKLRHMIAHVPMLTATGPLGVTVSVGATTLDPSPGEITPTVDALLGIAQHNLHASKRAGRNRVTAETVKKE